jgi:hypothetical protein
VEQRAHLPLQRREPVLERPARRRQLLGALRHVPRALLAHDPLPPPPLVVVLLLFLLGDLLEHAVELARGALHGLHLREEPRRGRGAGARSLLFLAPPLLRDPLLERGHGRRPLRLLRRRDGGPGGRGRPVLARHRADQRPHGEDEDGAHGVERQSEPAPRARGGRGGRQRVRQRREVRRHGGHVAARGPVLGDAEGERAHGARGGRGRGAAAGLGGCVVGGEEPGDGPARAREVRGVERRREEEAGRGGQRGAVRGPDRGQREGCRVENVERLDGAVEEVAGEAVGGGPGDRGGDWGQREHSAEGVVRGDDGVEELREEREGEERRGARARGGVRGERLEAGGNVGLEGVEREELIVLRRVEGGDGGGAAAEAEHAEEAHPGGRRRLGGGHGLYRRVWVWAWALPSLGEEDEEGPREAESSWSEEKSGGEGMVGVGHRGFCGAAIYMASTMTAGGGGLVGSHPLLPMGC